MIRILFIIIYITIMPFFAYAQKNNGNSAVIWQKNGIVINDSQGKSVRQTPRTVPLDDNSVVIVWEDTRNGYTDIYAQRFSSSGERLWDSDGVAICKADNNQSFPQIIKTETGQIIITWQDYRSGFSDIYAQRINIKGNILWQEDGIPICRAQANQVSPQITSDGNGGAILAWHDYRSGKGEDIYAQKISSSGSSEWHNDGQPVCIEIGTQWYPQIIGDGNGGAIICWDDKRSGYYDIYAQKLSSTGTPSWQENGIAVCSAPENQEYCQITSSEGDSFVIAWQDYRNGNADIYAQKLLLSGRFAWKMNGESVCNVAANQERPQIIGGKNPIITWTDFRNGTGNSDVYCQKISSDGKLMWDEYGVAICEAENNQGNPKMVSDGNEGVIITWQDNRDPQSTVYARRINKDGKPIWIGNGKTVSAPNSYAEFPTITSTKNNNIYIAWQDKRTGGTDVYVQKLDLIGNALWKKTGIEAAQVFGSVTQQKPKITKSGKGQYIITFEDYRNGHSNIYSQKINNSGKVLWDRDAVRICNFDSDQYNPDLVSDGDNGAIIVWEDTRDGFSKIYSQRVDSYGNILWDPNGIQICEINSEQLIPKICKDSNGGAIITWLDSRKKDGTSAIYVQKIDKNGNILWKTEGIPINTSGGVQASLKINEDGENGAIITWVEYKKNKNVNAPDVFAQRISADGKILWDVLGLAVCRAPEAQRNPELASNDNNIIIVWEDSGSGNYDIYAQKINRDGTIAWVCDGIPVCTAQYTQHEPKIIQNEDGGATITWEDYRNANWDIYAQRIDTAGGLVWEKDGIPICTANGTQYSPQIVKSKELSSIIVWEDYRNNTSYNIFAQKMSADGKMIWDENGISICMTNGGARNPQVVSDDDGGTVIVWSDFRYGNYDIYAQRINDGNKK